MPIDRSTRVAAALGMLAFCLSCNNSPQSPQKYFVQPLENLTSDASLDWQSAASAGILRYDLTPSRELAANPTRATRVIEGYFTQTRSTLSVHVAMRNPAAQTTTKVLTIEGPTTAGIVPLLDKLAHEIAPARPFSTRDASALHTYGEALLAGDRAAQIRLLQTAVVQDPKFTAASILLVDLLLLEGNRPEAAAAANTALTHATDPLDRAQLEYSAATASGNVAGREQALLRLKSLLPDDIAILDALAEVEGLERKLPQAIAALERITQLEPSNGAAFNRLAYLYAANHDLGNADRCLHRYAELAPPNDRNPTDSLGEVHYLDGDFAAAEKYFRQAGEPRKAAQARFLAGGLAAADALFAEALRSDQFPAILQAQWEWITGRQAAAIQRVKDFAATVKGDPAIVAQCQLAIWALDSGQSPVSYLATAKAQPASAQAQTLLALCQFIAAPPPNAPSPYFAGLAQFMAHRYSDAIPPLQTSVAQQEPTSGGAPSTFLAWSYIETNNPSAAKPLLSLFPLVWANSGSPFDCLVIPRFLQARSKLGVK